MSTWTLRTRLRRGRVSFVASVARDSMGALRGVNFAHADTLGMPFETRADAATMACTLSGVFGRNYRMVPHRVGAPEPTRKPRNPRGTTAPTADESARLDAAIASAYARAGALLPDRAAVHVYVTQGRRTCYGGRDRWQRMFISIDKWALRDERPGYLTYLVAHELAHVADVFQHGRTSHGPLFMACLKELCPPEFVAYELTYKQTAARQAGIRVSDAAPEVEASVRETLTRRICPRAWIPAQVAAGIKV